jgi:hypothetical protein
VEVANQDVGCLAQRVVRAERTVRPDAQDEPVKVGARPAAVTLHVEALAVHIEADPANRAEDGIYRDLVNWQATAILGREVAAPALDGHLDLDLRLIRIEGK